MALPQALSHLSLFSGCSAAQLHRAAPLLTTIDAAPGRRLMVQGSSARQFVIIDQGHVEVTHFDESGSPTATIQLGPDSHVGEVGLLDHVPCTATVTTLTPARVHVASASEFRDLIEILPVACNLRTVADDRLAANQLADIA